METYSIGCLNSAVPVSSAFRSPQPGFERVLGRPVTVSPMVLDMVETARLRGERPHAEHVAMYAELSGNPEVAAWLFPPPSGGGPRDS